MDHPGYTAAEVAKGVENNRFSRCNYALFLHSTQSILSCHGFWNQAMLKGQRRWSAHEDVILRGEVEIYLAGQ